MAVTALLFVLVTALLVLRHTRRTAEKEPSMEQAAGACPRCRTPLQAGAPVCPGCGAPPQVFDVIEAPVEIDRQEGAEPTERPHAVVRVDLCVGCGTCVDACPEDEALFLRDKIAVVDRENCVGHGSCIQACPVSAIFLNTGAAVQTVEVPDLNAGFESNVPGLYIVGELGGRGLIKNAVNEGRIAAEHVAASLRSAGAAGGGGEIVDLVVVGAGPAGLSAALEAQRLGLRFHVVDQGSLADTIRKYPRKKILFAEPVKVPLYGNLWVSDGSKETLLQLWETIVAKTGLKVQNGRRVEDIVGDEEGFRVITTSGDLRARKVILAMGRRGTPRRLGVPGEEAANVFYDIVEMETFRGRRVLVVGGGDSAVESALGLANQPDTPVTLSYRGNELKRVKERNRAKLEAKLAEGRIDLLLNSQVEEIREGSVLIEVSGETRALEADEVIVRIGGIPPTDFLRRVGVGSVKKSLALSLGLLLLAATPVFAQVSPGPLSRPHADLDRPAGCLECHGGGKTPMNEKCLDCHREIAWHVERRSGLHGQNKGKPCAGCHPDHVGREFELIDWGAGREAFDHRDVGYRLEGRHASLQCRECHRAEFQNSALAPLIQRKNTGKSWLGLERTCDSCHRDAHEGTLGERCRDCHGMNTWKPAPGFAHDATAYPLTGRHAEVSCEKCHRPREGEAAEAKRYEKLAHAECSDCHRDVHESRLGPACAGCHVTTGFALVSREGFDHARTRYPLRGRHSSVACASCHDENKAWGKRPPFQRCADCHTDAHAGQATLAGRAADCADCHDERGFEFTTYTELRHADAPYPLRGGHLGVECRKCHVKSPPEAAPGSLGRAGIDLRPGHERCRDCHRERHGEELARRDDGGACESCHRIESWVPSTYTITEHATLGFDLLERHAEIECAACHAKPVRLALDPRCSTCHLDPHDGRFADAGVRPVPGGCVACHDFRKFRPSTVSGDRHQSFAYRLEGAHLTVPCRDCHAELDAPPLPSTLRTTEVAARTITLQSRHERCIDCHRPFHGDQFAGRDDGGDCQGCHVSDFFRPALRFDHARDSRFAAGGAHATVSCDRCHPVRQNEEGKNDTVYRPLAQRCEDCHGRKPAKRVSLGVGSSTFEEPPREGRR